MNCWSVLGIEPTRDVSAIKRAYAARSRAVHPEDSPEDFRILHESYLAALSFARQDEVPAPEPSFPPEPAPAREDSFGGSPVNYRALVYEAASAEAEAVNKTVESTFARLDELSASGGTAEDFIEALGTPVSVGTRSVRVCFLNGFLDSLTVYLRERSKLPDELYEAIVLIYEIDYRRVPPRALTELCALLKKRKRLMTRREKRLNKLNRFFLLTPIYFLLTVVLFRSYVSDLLFVIPMFLMVVFIVIACVIGAKLNKPRDPSPYAADLRELRKSARK